MKLEGLWQTAAQNPYLFPLNFWMTPKLWDGGGRVDELVVEFLTHSFGPEAVEPGMRYVDLTERAWECVQTLTQYRSGFLGLFVVTFPNRMLPEKMIRDGVPGTVRMELEQAVEYAREALDAAEALADAARTFHALDANVIVVSAEVFCRRVEMRHAKLAVLDALHSGDVGGAVDGWAAVERACERMVAAARSAPNTDVLARCWRRLELLGGRLAAVAGQLAELAENKAFRPITQPLFIDQLYNEEGPDSRA